MGTVARTRAKTLNLPVWKPAVASWDGGDAPSPHVCRSGLSQFFLRCRASAVIACYHNQHTMQRLRGTLALIVVSCSAGLAQAPPAGYANAIREAEEMRARGDLAGIIRTLTSWVEKYP